MRVVLVSSPGSSTLNLGGTAGIRAPPLGLAYVASVLESAGYRVRIVDALTLGLSAEGAARAALSEKPDVVGISAITPTVKSGYRIAAAVKERDPEIPVIMGGPHVTFMYEEALANSVDFVVRGEGEFTALELLKHLEKGKGEPKHVRGLAYKGRDGRIVVTRPRQPVADLDRLPEPARHLLPMDRYTWLDAPVRVIHVMASRGCPYGCVFCSTSYFWGRRYRIRSARLVASEVERAVEKYKARVVVFSDDELTLIPKWVDEFVSELKERGLDIEWSCGSRVSSVSRELLKKMARAGCRTIYYGIESCSDEDLRRIGKGITVEQVKKAVEWSREAGIETVGSFILGFPWQTVDDMRRTVRFAESLGIDYAQFTVATPYPGTPLYRMAREQGLIEVDDWDFYTALHPVMRGFHFTRKQLSQLLSWAYRRFYLRPTYLLRHLIKGRLRMVWYLVVRAVKSRLGFRQAGAASV